MAPAGLFPAANSLIRSESGSVGVRPKGRLGRRPPYGDQSLESRVVYSPRSGPASGERVQSLESIGMGTTHGPPMRLRPAPTRHRSDTCGTVSIMPV